MERKRPLYVQVGTDIGQCWVWLASSILHATACRSLPLHVHPSEWAVHWGGWRRVVETRQIVGPPRCLRLLDDP